MVSLPAIRLYTAHPASGLRRLDSGGRAPAPAPYWAFPWAGGLALSHHVLAQPELVRSRRVFDLGAGSGLVAIAAALAGAQHVDAAEVDPAAIVAIGLNAAANRVAVTAVGGDATKRPPPAVDLILAGDVFYHRDVARRVMPFLDACRSAGIEVLIGDPGRTHLPRARLRAVAEYVVPDVGEAIADPAKPSTVFALDPSS